MSVERDSAEVTYPLGVVVEATGLSEHLLRAWERRHSIVRPQRTQGGSRRYRVEDIDRLRLVKAAVASGHRIGELSQLSDEDLRRFGHEPSRPPPAAIDRVLAALERFDEAEAEREIGLQLSALGAVEFCRSFSSPLLERIGEDWAGERLCPASEHLGSALLRSVLGGVLRANRSRSGGPTVLFATPPLEMHELGSLMAAIVAASAGVTPCYLGSGLPVAEIAAASETSGASVVALSVASDIHPSTSDDIHSIRAAIPPSIRIWLGGRSASQLVLPENVDLMSSLDDLEARARLLFLDR